MFTSIDLDMGLKFHFALLIFVSVSTAMFSAFLTGAATFYLFIKKVFLFDLDHTTMMWTSIFYYTFFFFFFQCDEMTMFDLVSSSQ